MRSKLDLTGWDSNGQTKCVNTMRTKSLDGLTDWHTQPNWMNEFAKMPSRNEFHLDTQIRRRNKKWQRIRSKHYVNVRELCVVFLRFGMPILSSSFLHQQYSHPTNCTTSEFNRLRSPHHAHNTQIMFIMAKCGIVHCTMKIHFDRRWTSMASNALRKWKTSER